MSLLSLVRPKAPGADPQEVLLAGLVAALTGVVVWFLPWPKWPRWATLFLVPLGLALVGWRNAAGGDDPVLYSSFYVVAFLWIGLTQPRWTSLKMMPLLVPAYIIPILEGSADELMNATSVLYVGVLCLGSGELLAWVTHKWWQSQENLREARQAMDALCTQIGGAPKQAAEVWQMSAERLSQLLDVPNVDIFRAAGDGEYECIASVAGGEPYPEYALGSEPGLWSIDEEALRTGQPLLVPIDDPRLTARERKEMEAWSESALLLLPMIIGEERVGIIELGETRPGRTFTPEHMATAASISHLVALSVHDVEVIEDRELQSRRLTALLDASQAIASASSTEEALRVVTSAATDLFGVTSGIAYEYEPDIDAIVPRAVWEKEPRSSLRLGDPLPLADLPIERGVLLSGATLVERLSDPHLDPVSRGSLERAGEKSCMTVPMPSVDGAMGLLTLRDSVNERQYSRNEIALARSLAELAGEAVRRGKLLRDLREREVALRSLYEAGEALIQPGLDYHGVLHAVARQLRDVLDCDECVVFEYDEDIDMLAEREGLVVDPAAYRPWDEWHPVEDYPLGRRLLEDEEPLYESLSDPGTDPESRRDMLRYGEKTCLSLPLRAGGRPMGFLVLTETEEERVFTATELEIAKGLATRAALAMQNARQHASLLKLHHANLRVLGAALNVKDPYTQGHAARVATYMMLLGRELGWSEQYMERVEEAAYLHDTGKLGISDRILLKPGPLNDEEWALMRQHPVVSADIVRPLLSQEFVLAVRHHHERYDGGGYPDGLAGQDIPPLARAFAVADSYDAMSRRRAYKRLMTREMCRDELVRCSGAQFDPAMVAAFLRVLDRMSERWSYACEVAATAARALSVTDLSVLVDRRDEVRPEYERVTAVLRSLRDAHPGVRFLTVARRSSRGFCFVADPEEDEACASHVGDPVNLDDEAPYGYVDEKGVLTVVDADQFGVWITGLAPLRDEDGRVAFVVIADLPADEHAADGAVTGLSGAYSSLIRESAERVSTAEHDVAIDSLTNLFSHRHFQERLDEGVSRAVRAGGSVTLLDVDIDHFRIFNHERGHRAGDDALREVARTIEGCTRSTDLIGRWGGGEFMVAMQRCSAADAARIAEEIRASVGEAFAMLGDEALSVSVGVAQLPADAAGKDELIEAATQALRAAKIGGRDQVVLYGDLRDNVQRTRGADGGARGRRRSGPPLRVVEEPETRPGG